MKREREIYFLQTFKINCKVYQMKIVKTPDQLNRQMEALERKAINRIVKANKARRQMRSDANREFLMKSVFGTAVSA